jgi:hypothetical protein
MTITFRKCVMLNILSMTAMALVWWGLCDDKVQVAGLVVHCRYVCVVRYVRVDLRCDSNFRGPRPHWNLQWCSGIAVDCGVWS